jgi:hypothetical protein
MVRHGGCQCGAIRFETTADPRWVAHCHCSDCRAATSSPFTTYCGFEREHVQWSGSAPRTFASSEGVVRSFCGTCGSALAYESTRWPDEFHLFACSFAEPTQWEPTAHVYCAHQLPWIRLDDGLKRLDTVSG